MPSFFLQKEKRYGYYMMIDNKQYDPEYPCHSESGQVCTTHRIWQKWLNITWRLCQKYHSHFCFASSWITHSGEKLAAILWGWIFKQPTKREFHLVPCRQPAPSSQLSECTILVAGCPAPGKPSDDYSPIDILTATSWQTPSQKHSVKPFPNSWPTGVKGDNMFTHFHMSQHIIFSSTI